MNPTCPGMFWSASNNGGRRSFRLRPPGGQPEDAGQRRNRRPIAQGNRRKASLPTHRGPFHRRPRSVCSVGGVAEPYRGALGDRVALGARIPGNTRGDGPRGHRHHRCGAGSRRTMAAVSKSTATDCRELKPPIAPVARALVDPGRAKSNGPAFPGAILCEARRAIRLTSRGLRHRPRSRIPRSRSLRSRMVLSARDTDTRRRDVPPPRFARARSAAAQR
jgi:hypothetical protein